MLNDNARAFAARMNTLLKEDVVVCADELVIPRRFTSGFLSLDVILGGGWPGNQWIELIGKESHGKTQIALKTVAVNQKLDQEFTTLWVASEHYDSEQATAMGVDNSRVVVASTQQMETAFQLMLEAVESKTFDCVILDSYPALLAEEEDDKAMDEFTVGAGARMVNKFIRKCGRASRRAPDGSERPFIGIIINQFRDRIGCLSYGNKVELASGQKQIGVVVNGQISDSVYSLDEDTGQVVKARIKQHHNNGPADGDWVAVEFRNFAPGKHRVVSCTPNHQVHTVNGWVEAEKLAAGDRVTVMTPDRLTYSQRGIIAGSLLGDGTPLHVDGQRSSPIMRFGHAEPQLPYLQWKHEVMGDLAAGSPVLKRPATGNQNAFYGFSSVALPEAIPLFDAERGRDFSADFFAGLSDLALAVWVQDDGSKPKGAMKVSVKSLTPAARETARQYLDRRFTGVTLHDEHVLYFSADATNRLSEVIAPWVHPSLQYKIPAEYRGRWAGDSVTGLPATEKMVAVYTDLVSVKPWSPTNSRAAVRKMHDTKFDIGIEGHHNYFVNGLLVHNSFAKFGGPPQTTPGGNGKNYFYYVRVEVKRTEYIEEKRPGIDRPVKVGQVIQFETVKNKSAAPKQVTEAEVYFRGAPFKGFRRGEINVAREYVAMGKLLGVITGSSWLVFGDRKFHGEPGLSKAMKEDPELQKQIAEAVLEAARDPRLIDEVMKQS